MLGKDIESRLKLNVIISFASYFRVIILPCICTCIYVIILGVLTSFMHCIFSNIKEHHNSHRLIRYCIYLFRSM